MTHGISLAGLERNDQRVVEATFEHNSFNNVVDSIDYITEQSVNDLTLLGNRDLQR